MSPPPARGRASPQKSADAFRTISEVSDDLGVPQHVLRFWETRFAQVKPMKRNGGRRLYRPDHVSLLRGIKALLYDDGLTIKGVQKILREQGVRSVVARGKHEAGEAAHAVPDDAQERLAALRARLDEGPQSPSDTPPSDTPPSDTPDAERDGDADRPRLDDAAQARVEGSIARLQAILDRLERD